MNFSQGSLIEPSNPFLFDQDVGDNIQEALDRLLLFPHDENLVTLARESAKNLHSYVPIQERIEKINSTVSKILKILHDNNLEFNIECYMTEIIEAWL